MEESDAEVTTTGDVPAGAKWHEFFCNPSDNTGLKSADGTYFRASSFRLSATSTVFKGMFESKTNRDIIEVDCSTAVLAAFLTAASSPTRTQIQRLILGCSTFAGLYNLCDFFDCPELHAYMTQELISATNRNPVATFRYAAYIDDVPLARRALGRMKSALGLGGNTLDEIMKVIRGIRPSWQAALLVPSLTPVLHGLGATEVQPDWAKLATSFNPGADTMAPNFIL